MFISSREETNQRRAKGDTPLETPQRGEVSPKIILMNPCSYPALYRQTLLHYVIARTQEIRLRYKSGVAAMLD